MNNKKTTNQPNMILVWFKALRPQAAFASICPVVVGLMIAHRHLGFVGAQGNMVAFLTLACAFALQTLSNLVNDYYDFKRGTDKQDRVGFERAMTTGLISEEEMRTACFITLGVAVFLGALLCWIGGWLILAVGVTAILFAWLYTATDYSLSYLGIADIFVLIYYGFVATMGTTYLQYKSVGLDLSLIPLDSVLQTSFYAGCVNGLISMCVLAINNIRDMEGDKESGKRTFPVRFGKTVTLIALAIIVMLMPVAAYMAFGLSWAMLIIFPAAYLYYRIYIAKGTEYNICMMIAGLINICFVVLTYLSVK